MSKRAVALLGLFAAACPDPDDADLPCPLRPGDNCDVRDKECQEHVHGVIACVREADHPLPTIRVIAHSEYIREYPPTLTPAEQRQEDQEARGAELLGLLPPGYKPSAAIEVRPPYIRFDFDTRAIIIGVDRSDPELELYGLLYAMALAHRDMESDLSALRAQAGSFDRRRALTTAYSGESTLFADLAWSRMRDRDTVAARLSYESWIGDVQDLLADPAEPYPTATSQFAYAYGAEYMRHAYLAGGPEAVSAAFDESSASTAYALGRWDGEIDAAFANIDSPVPDPPPGFRYVDEDSIGPVMYHMYRIRQGGQASSAGQEQQLAREWVGDRCLIAGTDVDDRLAVVWQLAGPGGRIDRTIVRATDAATLAAFEALFPAT
ncbi:hypothetical protein [Nannocystis sp. SCPEA4]|uniref:hypothetical protein n=1 Tax=Nannocystis sp. SCPEA4 TaxID=2996787 RepID=UPI00226E7300|nr:hypothetical protein [Nannocystis sp. SCPEA4]MCY1057488.1 hypothetical protein [Nannocystis sp. SCPEA4]